MALEKKRLDRWSFWLGGDGKRPETAREVTVPHTWNVEDGTEEYWGLGWYETEVEIPKEWKEKRVFLYFGAVYHEAEIWVNEARAGGHRRSGYTPFEVEITEHLRCGEKNRIRVSADNRFADEMLPCRRSFDWANDGGLIRPVELRVTGAQRLVDVAVTADPVITAAGERQEEGCAVFGVRAAIDGAGEALALEWELYRGCDGERTLAAQGSGLCGGRAAVVEGRVLEAVDYWHFDRPQLYTVKLSLLDGANLADCVETVVGFRKFEVRSGRFYLNGEPVRLAGTEWMPGSDPVYGMAEPKEQLEKMLLCLKESNSVLTRFHWQQDDWVYDWCDRHGLLVQEEVPFWGKDPELAGELQLDIFCQQMGEMVRAHRNHPSIIAWGVGNELAGQAPETIQYIKDAVAWTHRLDPARPANYVSNTIFEGAELDGTTDGDILMVNDYIGTWHGDRDQCGEWDKITAKNPDRAVIPSEFGLCEPAFSGGDARRTEIFLEKIRCYRQYPNIAGTVYFCLNDYRTQMGEDGEGKLRKRVHGSAGLCGEPKPSYFVVREEYAPVQLSRRGQELTLSCRSDFPCYAVKGYYLTVNEERIPIPDLKPGERCAVQLPAGTEGAEVQVYRPDGDRVL